MALPILLFSGYLVKKTCDMIVHFTGGKGTNTNEKGQRVLENVDKKLENLDKDIADKIKEQLDDQSSSRERLTEIKGMSKEERAELFRDLKDENSREQQAINKELQSKLDKQEKQSIQLAKELKEAQQNGDGAKVVQLTQMIKDNDKNQQSTRLALKKNEEEAKKQIKALEEYFKLVEQNKPWYLDMNFKSPWLWGILLFSCLVFYLSFKSLVWTWSKIKPLIWGDNQ